MPLDDATRVEAIERLNVNIGLEHAAIVQYLLQVYRLDPPGLAEEVEVIAREEMYHLWGFAEQVLRLGGTPRLDRATVFADAANLTEMLILGASGEDGAISKYTEDIRVIDDEKIREFLARVIRDEQQHRLKWRTWLARQPDVPADMDAAISAAPQTGEGSPPPYVLVDIAELIENEADHSLEGRLNAAILAQYHLVLSALQDYFAAWGTGEAEELLRRAVREMKHLGDLSEAVGEGGAQVDYPRLRPPEGRRDLAASLRNEALAGEAVERVSQAAVAEGESDPILADVLRRMADDHRYYQTRLPGILPPAEQQAEEELPAPPPPPDPSYTRRVRDLYGRPQE